MQDKDMQQKRPRKLSRFLPLLVLLILIVLALGLGSRVNNEKSRLLEEKSDAVVQERPPVNVVVQEMAPALLRDRLNLPGMVEPV